MTREFTITISFSIYLIIISIFYLPIHIIILNFSIFVIWALGVRMDNLYLIVVSKSILLGLLIIFHIYIFFFRIYTVIDESMEPNFQENDMVYGIPKNWLTWSMFPPHIGDVIIFSDPLEHKYYIKRIKKITNDPCIFDLTSKLQNKRLPHCLILNKQMKKIETNQNYYFVIGDNIKKSTDSRVFGWVPENDVLVKVKGKISFL